MNIKNVYDSGASNDLEKIELCQSGNSEAFSFLVEKYKNMVYQLALRLTGNYHDSEDIAQESFLKAYHSLHQFNPSYSFSSWLYKITLNTIRDRARKKNLDLAQSFSQQEDDFPEQETANTRPLFSGDSEFATNPEEWQVRQENQQAIQTAINALPLPQKEIIILRHLQNLSYYEIAQILHIPLNSVKVRLHRARTQLKTLLEELK
ncbi:MAG TPA: sigma-70 family RNA polymerase sigma factor [Atribacterota bacterium]|nr:sigma-70 family RNA polymerase sigma factor [Atribacterota bacterium]